MADRRPDSAWPARWSGCRPRRRSGPDLLLSAYRRADADCFTGTDTAACVERYAGIPVHCIPGDPRNVKVTYRADLVLAERLLSS